MRKDRKKDLQQYGKHYNFNREHNCILYKTFYKKVVIPFTKQHTAPKASQSNMDAKIDDKFAKEYPQHRNFAPVEEYAVNKKFEHGRQSIPRKKDSGRDKQVAN